MDFNTQIALSYVAMHKDKFRDGFADFLKDSPNVWLRFREIANQVWEGGRRHYSARTIIEVMRHETLIREANSAFKINNDHAPQMARLYGLMYADRAGLFQLREKESA